MPSTVGADGLTVERRRTIRQRDAIANGIHPLALVVGDIVQVHPDASRTVASTRAANQPLTCGSCVFRQLYVWPSAHKCRWQDEDGNHPHSTSSVATDVRGYFPACTRYQAKA